MAYSLAYNNDMLMNLHSHAFEVLITQLTYVLNLSIQSCKFPTAWKKAQVTPIPKDGNPLDVNNYRPISLLPIPSKIIEHLIHKQVDHYLDNTKFFTDLQGGFRKEHSTTATTSEFLDDIYTNINKQTLTRAVFVDFRKGFDSINHKLLLLKLKYAGFCKNTLSWFESYLTNRQQTVRVNNMESTTLPVTCGVPQGSTLGPQLFLIFINDIVKVFKWSKFRLYADDTVFYTSDTENDDLTACQHLQEDLSSLSLWCTQNAITINVKKTKAMTFGTWYTLSRATELKVSLHGTNLENVDVYKYLGTYVDKKLNFERQANETIRLVNHKLHCLIKIKQFISSEHCVQLYKTYIQPYFDYNDIFLEATTARLKTRLENLQRYCLRSCLPRNRAYHKSEIYRYTGVNRLPERTECHLLKLMYRRSQKEKYLSVPNRHTRQHEGKTLTVPFPVNESLKKSQIFKGSNTWNNLTEIRNIPSFKAFKNCMKKRMLENLL